VIRATIDTNILASGFIRPGPPPGQILQAWRSAAFTLVLSAHILDELERTFEEPYCSRQLNPTQRAENLALLRAEALFIPIDIAISGVATHPEDGVVLATALSGGASHLVTGDVRFRTRVSEYQGVRLLSPTEFLEILRGR
jgi:putative PIN family toxin of toxin-antitoxin system